MKKPAKRPNKSANKSARKSARPAARKRGKPFRKGHDSRQGRGPKKGAPNAGRPPLVFIDLCRGIVNDPKVVAQVRKILRNADHAAFAAMWGKLTDRSYGHAAARDEEGDLIALPIEVRVVRTQAGAERGDT